MTVAEEVAKILLDIKAITFKPKDPYRFSSGILSPVYSDHRLLMGYPKERRLIVSLMANEVWSLGLPDFVAGTAMGAIPHASFVAELLILPLVYVRNKPKDHGKKNLVEGLYKPGQTAIVIEDLISTGQSSIGTVSALRDVGCHADHIVCITDYMLASARKNMQEAKVKLHNLTDFPTIVNVAIIRGEIKEKDREMVLDWISAPEKWGKKMGLE